LAWKVQNLIHKAAIKKKKKIEFFPLTSAHILAAEIPKSNETETETASSEYSVLNKLDL